MGENSMRETYLLWENGAPGQINGCEEPKIHYCPAEHKTHSGTVVIFAGGAYTGRAPHEDVGYAEFLNADGMSVFYVDYRVAPYQYPCALLDARRAVRFVRANAERFGIDPQKIAVMGSSAGGNLCALLTSGLDAFPEEGKDALDAVDGMPNAQILCYPYISMTDPELRIDWCSRTLFGEDRMGLCEEISPECNVCSRTPTTFIFHTAADSLVNVIHSYSYASALRRNGTPVEMHIFPDGDHGLGLSAGDSDVLRHDAQWGELLLRWLSYNKF